MYTPFNPPMENYFPPSQHQFFFTAFTYFYLCAFILSIRTFSYSWSSAKNLFLFVIICENHFLFMVICKNLFLFVIICQNHFLFMIICENLFLFMIICKNSFFICQNLFSSVCTYFYLWEFLFIYDPAKIFSYL